MADAARTPSSLEEKRAYSGHPLFDEFVARGADPDLFNNAYGHFTTRNPLGDFAEAVASVAAKPTSTQRVARAAELFGRAGVEIATFSS